MHILLVHQYFLEDHDGGGSRWNEMSRIWIERGHQVTVLAGMGHYMHSKNNLDQGKWFTKQINRDGVKVIRCYVANSVHAGFLQRLFGQFSFVFSAIWAGVFCAKEHYDVVLCTSPPLFVGIVGLFISKIKNLDLVFEVRDLWPESAIGTGVLKNRFLIKGAYWLEEFLYKKANAINVLTPAFAHVLINQKHVNADKIWLISNAADFSVSENVKQGFDRQAFRKKLGLDDCFVIIYVGAHGIANHLIHIIETAAILKSSKAHFVLIGDGPQKAKLIAEAHRRALQNVMFLDTISKSEVFKYILAADAGASVLKKADIFKTIYSNKTFDYFACSKPVLLAIDGISRKLVEDANAGMFVAPENPADFADKILKYIKDPDLAAEHGKNGYTYASIHFDRRLLARKYLENIEMMLKMASDNTAESEPKSGRAGF